MAHAQPPDLNHAAEPSGVAMPPLPAPVASLSVVTRNPEPGTPNRESSSPNSPGPGSKLSGVTKSGRRRRRHPVAEIKGGWTAEEDAKLKELVEKYGEGSWSKLVPHFQGRIGKQLRERWNHELRPDIMKGAWTEEEEAMLVVQHRIHRNAWADIAKMLPGRTCNAVKNHWNATLRRVNRGPERPLQGPVERYMQELGLIDSKSKRSQTHRTHNFQGQPSREGPPSGAATPVGQPAASTARWVPVPAPAHKIPPTARAPGSFESQAESSRAGPSGVEGQEQSLPGTPRMQTVTPAQLPPGILAPAASTAMSAPAPLALAELMHPSAIARKWGHALLDSKQTATPSTANTLEVDIVGLPEGCAAAWRLLDDKPEEAASEKKDMEVEQVQGSAGDRDEEEAGPSQPAEEKSEDGGTGPSSSDASGEENGRSPSRSRRGSRSASPEVRRVGSRGGSSGDEEAAALRRSKRQRLAPQDPMYHFFQRSSSPQAAPQQKGPVMEEAAMALLLLDGSAAPQGAEAARVRGQRTRGVHAADARFNEDEHTLLPHAAKLPRKARRLRTGPGGAGGAMRQVADAATQTASPPSNAGTGAAALWPAASRPEDQQQQQGQAAMYGVNAAVATSKSSLAGGRAVPFATTVNVRDRLAGFIVSLASVADRWEMRPSADKDRFRQGLGRSTDSKVVALRQAVLEKCVAVKGPSPGQAVHAMAALLAEMAPIITSAYAAAADVEQGPKSSPPPILQPGQAPAPCSSEAHAAALNHSSEAGPSPPPAPALNLAAFLAPQGIGTPRTVPFAAAGTAGAALARPRPAMHALQPIPSRPAGLAALQALLPAASVAAGPPGAAPQPLAGAGVLMGTPLASLGAPHGPPPQHPSSAASAGAGQPPLPESASLPPSAHPLSLFLEQSHLAAPPQSRPAANGPASAQPAAPETPASVCALPGLQQPLQGTGPVALGTGLPEQARKPVAGGVPVPSDGHGLAHGAQNNGAVKPLAVDAHVSAL